MSDKASDKSSDIIEEVKEDICDHYCKYLDCIEDNAAYELALHMSEPD